MPRCIHAIERRVKNPHGLPEAHRLWVERRQALQAYRAARDVCINSLPYCLLPRQIFDASTEELRQETELLLEMNRKFTAPTKAPAAPPRVTPKRSMWECIFGLSRSGDERIAKERS